MRGGRLGTPWPPLEPLPLPSARAAQRLLRSGVSRGDGEAAGTAAGSASVPGLNTATI